LLALFTLLLTFVSAQHKVQHLPDGTDHEGDPLLHDPGWIHWPFDPHDLPYIEHAEDHDVVSEGENAEEANGAEDSDASDAARRRRSLETAWTRDNCVGPSGVAHAWYTHKVMYEQTPDVKQFVTKGKGLYRSDCSGFVSACWNIAPPGEVTQTLQVNLVKAANMIRGDAFLARSHHVALFWGWFRGAAVVFEESTWGEPAKFATWAPSYWKTYEAVRHPGWGQHDKITPWKKHGKRSLEEVAAVAEVEEDQATEGWALYKQCGQSWSGHRLGTCSLTICDAGCAMSSCAAMLTTFGHTINPGQLNDWLTANGGYAGGCSLYWGKVDAFGLTRFQSQQWLSESQICNYLGRGYGIVANVRGGSHWVLLTGCRGGGVFSVSDSGFSSTTYSLGNIVTNSIYAPTGKHPNNPGPGPAPGPRPGPGPAPHPKPSGGIAVGKTVTPTVSSLNCRNSPSLNGAVKYTWSSGQTKKVTSGPRSANGYEWWQVNGQCWSAGSLLRVA